VGKHRKPHREYKEERCPYDGTALRNGEACPACADDIRQHVAECRRCAGDLHDLLAREGDA
jgi:hypothetical protein